MSRDRDLPAGGLLVIVVEERVLLLDDVKLADIVIYACEETLAIGQKIIVEIIEESFTIRNAGAIVEDPTCGIFG